jgi:hypothetical protein
MHTQPYDSSHLSSAPYAFSGHPPEPPEPPKPDLDGDRDTDRRSIWSLQDHEPPEPKPPEPKPGDEANEEMAEVEGDRDTDR